MKKLPFPDELKDAPLLRQLHGKNPYRIPENYFETLAGRIERKIENKPAVVRRISFSRMAARFAAAASVILFLGTAGWLYFNKKASSLQEEYYFTPEQISSSVYFDDLDLTLLKEEAAGTTEPATTSEIENYLLEHDLTFLSE